MTKYLDSHMDHKKVISYLVPPLIYLGASLLTTILGHLKYQTYDMIMSFFKRELSGSCQMNRQSIKG